MCLSPRDVLHHFSWSSTNFGPEFSMSCCRMICRLPSRCIIYPSSFGHQRSHNLQYFGCIRIASLPFWTLVNFLSSTLCFLPHRCCLNNSELVQPILHTLHHLCWLASLLPRPTFFLLDIIFCCLALCFWPSRCCL